MNAQGNRKWWVLGALAICLLTVGLDLTVLNLALPTLATDLHATNGELQWFADAYNLVLAAVLLPAGLLGDRLGRKKMLIVALILFGVASGVCAYADSAGELIAGRALLGLGAAFMLPLSMSIIPVLFTEKERPKAIGIWVTANSIGIPLGPILGGWLLNNYWWGSVFLINVPIIILGLIAVSILLPESRSAVSQRVDLIGTLASSLGLVGVTYGVIEAGEKGWGDPASLAMILAGAAVLIGFIRWEQRTSHPLIDLSLFRSASFTWGSILATIVSFAMFGLLFVTPQYFQAVGGADALGTGLRLLPIVGGLLIGAQIGDRIKPRLGAQLTIAFGFLLLIAGFVIGAQTGMEHGYVFASLWISMVGLGIGFVLPAAMDVAMSALSAETSGVGSALIMTLRNVGGAIGVAVLGTVLSTGYRDILDVDGLPGNVAEEVRRSVSAGTAAAGQLNSRVLLDSVHAAFIHGMDTMLWVCGGLAALGFLLTLTFLRLRVNKDGKPEFRQMNMGE
ncbi:DHA2 family efflux MFS transporter permease subunit [Paenibacillus eucommiae]|uniref:EmrB/QacA subfamily drug resistance transporter n=1 Tax=Paenibacillus eucommiae TaxID=1355755 RepID=A0ABS4IWC5_9BACL|nr:DHA2 family efflux MFS transporter permease subunit [Paenibacillus eucommiae]MBP1991897.1 EmrB/QacA subfamily drug resistance transporter [Paenibacillus eucommiae]